MKKNNGFYKKIDTTELMNMNLSLLKCGNNYCVMNTDEATKTCVVDARALHWRNKHGFHCTKRK